MRLWVLAGFITLSCALTGQQHSVRFFGNGPSDIDRIKIPIDNPPKPVDVSLDFTIEFWMKANPGANTASVCDGTQWYFSNIIVDRDVDGAGDYGDYGIGLGNRRILAGVERLNNGPAGVCGNTIVDDGAWHHIALTRKASNGEIRLFVDGVLDAMVNASSATGDISYRDNRNTSQPNSDPFLVLGAEKHDYPGSMYFNGWMDELRISSNIRYTGTFQVPTDPFAVDAYTVALYHFNAGSGTQIQDVLNSSNGIMKPGGSPTGPVWSTDTPFICSLEVSNANDSGDGSLRRAILCAEDGQTITFNAALNGQTILLNSRLIIDRDIQIINNNALPVTVEAISDVVVETRAGENCTFKNIRFSTGSLVLPSLQNFGNTILENCIVRRISPSAGIPVIINSGSLSYVGQNQILPD